MVVAFLGTAAIGIGIGLLGGYSAAHTEEKDRLNRFRCAPSSPSRRTIYPGN